MRTLTATLSYKSLDGLLKELRQYQTDFFVKVNDFMEKLAAYGAEMADECFGGAVEVTTVQVDQNTWAVVANGAEVGFLEFGAGVYSDSSHELARSAPFKVYPGSWSEEHGKRWEQWLEAGKDPYEFPYNIVPLYGLLTAYNMMRDHALEIGREVFGS